MSEPILPSGGVLALPPIYDRSDKPGVALMRYIRQNLEEAGLPRNGDDPGAEMNGLVAPGAFGDTGFSVKELSEKELEFHVVISGDKTPEVNFTDWNDWQSGYGTMNAHQPLNQKVLHPRIRDVFRELGFVVKKVKDDSFEKYDNFDLSYTIITDYPEILKITPADPKDKSDGVDRQWDAFFDSMKPMKKY